MASARRTNFSTLGIKHERNEDSLLQSADQWLEDKRRFDGAEGLWRIHDGLYDFTQFIDRHPGGRFWIKTTKGLDLTEAWESHHISSKPELLLPKYFRRKALTPRNSPFTFHDGDFYRTLKRNVRPTLRDVSQRPMRISNHIDDALVATSFLLSTLSTFWSSYLLCIAAGICTGFCLTAGHNFYHKKDNFRMYYNDIFMVSSRDFRIMHVLSHHQFPNSVSDLQAYIMEPSISLYPGKKSFVKRYFSYVYVPLAVWPTLFLTAHCAKLYECIVLGNLNHIGETLLAWILPLFMYLVTGQPLLNVLTMWIFITAISGTCFGIIGFATSHYHPEIFMDGDKAREDQRDWGIGQLDTVAEKVDVVNTHFLGMILLGDHALHHLFPSLDHGVIQSLYPIFEETLKAFNLKYRVLRKRDLVRGFFWRLSNESPNINPPN